MSWVLFNHNQYPTHLYDPIDPNNPPNTLPPEGSTTQGTLWWTNLSGNAIGNQMGWCGNPYGNLTGTVVRQNFVATDGDQRAMVIRHHGGSLEYTDDLGANWYTRQVTSEVLDDYTQGKYLRALAYWPRHDAWVVIWMWDVVQQSAQQRRGWLYISTDNGANWALMDDWQDVQRDCTEIVIDSNGDLVIIGTAYFGTNLMGISKYTQVYQETPQLLEFAAAGYGSRLAEIMGGYYLGNSRDDDITELSRINPDLSGYTRLGGTIGSAGSNANYWAADPNGIMLCTNGWVGDVLNYEYCGPTDAHPFPAGAITFDGLGHNILYGTIVYGGGMFLAAASNNQQPDIVSVKTSPTGLPGSWSEEYYFNTVLGITTTSGSWSGWTHWETAFSINYIGNGLWTLAFQSTTPHDTMHMALLDFGDALNPVPPVTNLYPPLHAAIAAQQPDIFFKMDDEQGAQTVLDIGLKQYANQALGDLEFQRPGLVDDGGKALQNGGGSILVAGVPTPTHHAHVFIMRAGTLGAQRTLIQSDGYSIAIEADNTVSFIIGETPVAQMLTPLEESVTQMFVVIVDELEQEVIFHLDDQWVSSHAVTLPLSVVGSMALAGEDTTIDYYALIPRDGFDTLQILEPFDPETPFTPPPAPTTTVNTPEFLLHADETAVTGPFISQRVAGTGYYKLINSVPGSINRVSTEVAEGRLVQGAGKFGDGAGFIAGKAAFHAAWAWDSIYWPVWNATPSQMGIPETEIGNREFTYDLWAKAMTPAGMILASSRWLYYSGGRWVQYGGITISTQPENDTTKCRVDITIGGAKGSNVSNKLVLTYRNIPGFNNNQMNHYAIGRSHGIDGQDLWHIHVNGYKATRTGIQSQDAASRINCFIPRGESWGIGTQVVTRYDGSPPSAKYGRIQRAMLVDEARLVLGECVFKDSFLPPVAAYEI